MNVFKFDPAFFLQEVGTAIQYIPVALLLAIFPLLVGLVFGSLIAVARLFRVPLLAPVLQVLVVVIRGVPIVLLLTILFLFVSLGLDQVAAAVGLKVSSTEGTNLLVALFGMSLSATAYLSEAIRSALESVPPGQYEAARSIGLTSFQLLRRIVIPQAFPVAIPLLGNNLIGLIKGSAVASLISVTEMLAAVEMAASQNYKFLEGYVGAAVIYWALCFGVERLTSLAESRVKKY